jgi:hypothetical protein
LGFVVFGCAMTVNVLAPSIRGERPLCSEGSVWGCSEKVPTATGFVENDRVEGAIDKKPRQWHVAGGVRSLRLWGLGV